jgi:hypothetical protein
VTANKEITVTAWIEPQRPIVPEKRAPKRFFPPALIGVVGTLALHMLALETAFLGSRAYKNRPPEVQEPDSADNHSAASPAENLVFIDLPKIARIDRSVEEALASFRAAMKEKPIPVSLPDPSPPTEVEILALGEDKPSESSNSGDGVERGRLFGIYIGQIQARVERIWRRPRTPVNDHAIPTKATNADESFQCQVQIVQDAKGYVQEVLLPHCNGSSAWQHSLVLAIQQASPLPAPPSQSVFSHSIALVFVGLAYGAGAPEDDYEIAPIKIVPSRIDIPDEPPHSSYFRPSTKRTSFFFARL